MILSWTIRGLCCLTTLLKLTWRTIFCNLRHSTKIASDSLTPYIELRFVVDGLILRGCGTLCFWANKTCCFAKTGLVGHFWRDSYANPEGEIFESCHPNAESRPYLLKDVWCRDWCMVKSHQEIHLGHTNVAQKRAWIAKIARFRNEDPPLSSIQFWGFHVKFSRNMIQCDPWLPRINQLLSHCRWGL